MAPYSLPPISLDSFVLKHSRPYLRIMDNFYTLRSLCKGFYTVDAPRVIDRMAERISKRGGTKIVCTGFHPGANLIDITAMLLANKEQARIFLSDLGLEVENAEAAAILMDETARTTKRELGLHLIVAGGFTIGGIASLLLKKKALSAICLFAAASDLLLFWDHLSVRSEELNEHYDTVRDLCNQVADGFIELSSVQANHNFSAAAARKRYGAELFDDLAAISSGLDPEIYETFNPDAEPLNPRWRR